MGTIRLILGDQLSDQISSLKGADKKNDVILMLEVMEECSYVPHHKQKIVLFLSAMRHFSDELRLKGYSVDYVKLDDPQNTGTLTSELKRAMTRWQTKNLILTEPGEWRVQKLAEGWSTDLKIKVEIVPDDRFFASKERFREWALGRRTWRMEYFYRELRKENQLLIENDKPVGGSWNFDAKNRKSLPRGFSTPSRVRFSPDQITREVMELVSNTFENNFGNVENFSWPVTRSEALEALKHFLRDMLPLFGDYQDAMKAGERFLFHSLLSTSLNIGLLLPQEVCRKAEAKYENGDAPINAVEGFIRQVLGWREYIRGVYWTLMPEYANSNGLDAYEKLPGFYWDGKTDLNCLKEAITATKQTAYSHHIQRLMITGNFALLAGVNPQEVERWYLSVYSDAIEWVEMPNTLGMAMHADGGKMASKPYISSGAYINRMSDFCGECKYNVKEKTGPNACPFNYLYWAFLIRNEEKLSHNPRMGIPYRNLSGWTEDTKGNYLKCADNFLKSI